LIDLVDLHQRDTHRLIPSKYLPGDESVLARFADNQADLDVIFDLDHATNDRLLAENGRSISLSPLELVGGVPHYRLINAAFVHAAPTGSRFNGPDRGAWYAGFELETSIAEIVFHATAAHAEINVFHDEVTYDDLRADFAGQFHDLRNNADRARWLDPTSYVASQGLAAELLANGSAGIVYPSVRAPNGTCIACFRPPLVGNVRRGTKLRLRWTGAPDPAVEFL
jgi:RES domain-containing protein